MINNYLKKFNKIQVLIDACIIVISYHLAYYLSFYALRFDFLQISVIEKYAPLNKYTDKLMFLVLLYLFLYYFFEVYTPNENKLTLTKVFRIILTNILGVVLFLFTLYFQKGFDIARYFIILFFVINVILSIGVRMLYFYCLKIMRKKQHLIS